mmetsp:Transcript_55427/g.113336  ORF Transcript_55427/g.113336 Transcript_55427/m.113336 type:complete len:1034 (+) Transcript_55427:96-3197(+)|eukprot:CAMPEP_0181315648 /NCGR_PEP_ID=MMETSP1101-20121128/15487_1 /TAXON_ID=46948 /ORGANISM="Rhodomonas abbreviata, Strain Caron Lab Isolate" /LENGTH=1033 /DNA_ID=CAMNT_0023422869 /DNA_START=96 /DNA_END=3197 /DNA_ORIENTATION=+
MHTSRIHSRGLLWVAVLGLAAFSTVTQVGANLSGPRKLLTGDVRNLVRANRIHAEGGLELTQYLVRVHQENAQAQQLLEKLESVSHGVVRYFPHDTYSLVLLPNEVEKVLDISGVEGVYEMPASMKRGPPSKKKSRRELPVKKLPDDILALYQRIPVIVDLSVTKDKAAELNLDVTSWAKKIKEALGCSVEVSWAGSHRLKVLVDVKDDSDAVIEWLSNKVAVHFVTEKPEVFLKNKWAGNIIQSGNASKSLLADKGLDGEGQIIGCADSGIDYDSCFFSDPAHQIVPCKGNGIVPGCANMNHRKIVTYRTCSGASNGDDETVGHGTHVAGTIGGSASHPALSEYNGIAPAAKIAFDDVGKEFRLGGERIGLFLSVPEDLYEELFPHSYALGAKVHTNSWGSATNEYDLMSSDIDRFVHENEDFLVLFAAGNDGPRFGTLGAPAGAKNILSIGAGQNDAISYPAGERDSVDFNNLADFSSKGPTPDGRFKPDVVCPGENIDSAESDGDVNSNQCTAGVGASIDNLSGTSMATPGCAGGAALVRQYFSQGFFQTGARNDDVGFEPTAALVKAVMLHSGQPMWYLGTSGEMEFPATLPHVSQGYGRVDLSTVLWFGDDFAVKFYNRETVQRGMSTSYCFDVPSGSQFKATLVWTDKEASPLQSNTKVLIQDLDLMVTSPTGAVTMGNHLRGNVADRANNNEQVTIVSAEPGVYTVDVSAHDLPAGSQNYALVVTGAAEMVPGPCVEIPCPEDCSGNGQCKRGQCVCDIGFTGEACATAQPYLSPSLCAAPVPGSPFSGDMEPAPLTSPTGQMSVAFRTDATTAAAGFALLYTASGTSVYSNSCSGNRGTVEITREAIGVISGSHTGAAECRWGLGPEGATSVTMYLEMLDLEMGFDFLTIEACADTKCRSKQEVGRFTGTRSGVETVFAPTPYVLITLKSDTSINGAGFRLTFAGNNVISQCRHNTLTPVPPSLSAVILTDGPGEYKNSLACAWLIDAGAGKSVDLAFIQFDTEMNYDQMEVQYVADDCAQLPAP